MLAAMFITSPSFMLSFLSLCLFFSLLLHPKILVFISLVGSLLTSCHIFMFPSLLLRLEKKRSSNKPKSGASGSLIVLASQTSLCRSGLTTLTVDPACSIVNIFWSFEPDAGRLRSASLPVSVLNQTKHQVSYWKIGNHSI